MYKKALLAIAAFQMIFIAPSFAQFTPKEEHKKQYFKFYSDFVKKMTKDEHIEHANFLPHECPFCKKNDPGEELEQKLTEQGFKKIKQKGKAHQGHCTGVTYLFARYALNHPLHEMGTCTEIFEASRKHLLEEDNTTKRMHAFSVNQPSNYFTSSSNVVLPEGDFNLSEAVPEKTYLKNVLFQDLKSMEQYYQICLGQAPSYYYCPHPFSEEVRDLGTYFLYSYLKENPNQLLLIEHKKNGNYPHILAIYSHPEKHLIFDPNLGLIEFSDEESLCLFYQFVLRAETIDSIAAFTLQRKVL